VAPGEQDILCYKRYEDSGKGGGMDGQLKPEAELKVKEK